MIKILTSKIDFLGEEIEGSIAINDLVNNDLKSKLISDLNYDLKVSKLSEGLLISGYAEVTLREECSRCLNKFEMNISNDQINVFIEDNIPDVLDVSDKIIEEIMIKIPAYPICDKDCEGICQGCGVNLNEEYCECRNEQEDENVEGKSVWAGLENLKI